MTYIPGIAGLHAWTPPGEESPAVTLGLLRDLETGEPISPRFRILEIAGLDSLGEVEDPRDPRVGGVGEIARPGQDRGKSVAYTCRIEADSELELGEAKTLLRAAFRKRGSEGRMDLSVHPGNVELAGVTPKFYEAKALSLDIIDKQLTRRYDRIFVLGLRMGDPRVFEEDGFVASIEIAETNEAGEFAVSEGSGSGS